MPSQVEIQNELALLELRVRSGMTGSAAGVAATRMLRLRRMLIDLADTPEPSPVLVEVAPAKASPTRVSVVRLCVHCGASLTEKQRRQCTACRKRRGGGNAPRHPCIGCGKLLWGGRGSLPPGQRMCRECRRTRRPAANPVVWHERQCLCGAWFSTRHGHKKWCATDCPAKLRKYYRNKSLPQRRGRAGHHWRQLRAKVLAEEMRCWLCDEMVDKARKFPDPWSPSVDHVVLAALGGTTARDNLRLAHFRCNIARGGWTAPRGCPICGKRFRGATGQKTCGRTCGVEYRRRSDTY